MNTRQCVSHVCHELLLKVYDQSHHALAGLQREPASGQGQRQPQAVSTPAPSSGLWSTRAHVTSSPSHDFILLLWQRIPRGGGRGLCTRMVHLCVLSECLRHSLTPQCCKQRSNRFLETASACPHTSHPASTLTSATLARRVHRNTTA